MKVVLWPYRYDNMRQLWCRHFCWLVTALKKKGACIKRHPKLICKGLEDLPVYDHRTDNPCDVAIYNHATQADLAGNVIKSFANWFLKPTVPDENHATLDTLGYGPYSSITYKRPPYLYADDSKVEEFFATTVAGWTSSRVCKWGDKLKEQPEDPGVEDFYLVLGQCAGDSVVTAMDFGGYVAKLNAVVAQLLRADSRPVVVKLHPYMNGTNNEQPHFSKKVQEDLLALSPQRRVKVVLGKCSVHPLIARSRAVVLANSGAGFEAMMHRKPIISWGFPEYHWVTYDLRLLCDMKRAIRLDWFDAKAQSKFLYWYMQKYCFFDQASADFRVDVLRREIEG